MKVKSKDEGYIKREKTRERVRKRKLSDGFACRHKHTSRT